MKQFADNGGLVLGICNGFQVLCEAGLLPGALIRNRSLQFRCEHVFLKTITTDSPFTNQIPAGKFLRVPIAHALANPNHHSPHQLPKSRGQTADTLVDAPTPVPAEALKERAALTGVLAVRYRPVDGH